MPPSVDKSDAWYERFVILRFDKQFLATGENKPDRTLKAHLDRSERIIGVAKRALMCGKETLKRGRFTKSDKNDQSVEKYKFLNDPVLKFISELPDFVSLEDGDFYDAYKDWCYAEGLAKPLSKTRLAAAAEKHGIQRIRKNEDGKRFFSWVNSEKS